MTKSQKRIVFILVFILIGLATVYFSQDFLRNLLGGDGGSGSEAENTNPLTADQIQKALETRYANTIRSSTTTAAKEKRAEQIQEALESNSSPEPVSQGSLWSYENYPAKDSSSLSAAEIQKYLESKKSQ